ncbi:MAG: amino acid permease [Bifidobacteriaceae bacterium]|jgi:putative glutamate/gamma-aminobutyrate antiporter|nr:amino acid permease [Bifidobacteriaceae bacterium]
MAITDSHPIIPTPASPPGTAGASPGAGTRGAASSANSLPDAAHDVTPAAAGPAGREPRTYLTVFNIAMMTTVTVMSLRSLPAIATYGLGSVTMFVVPAVLFLIPTALVGAELATTWKGGIYVWVRQAMSNRMGFLAIWLQWIQNVVWYPTQLAFIAASLAFMIGVPSLSNSGLFTAIIILAVYWIATAITLRGGNLFAKISSWGGVIGTIIPAALLIVLGIMWLAGGTPSQTPLEARDVIPPYHGISSIVLVVSNVLAFAGMEVNAVHAGQMRDPRRGFTRATLLSFALILLVCIPTTIAIAVAVPQSQLGFTNGINMAFQVFFTHFHVNWATNVISWAIAVGAIASVISWVAGPSTGLLAAARTGLLPPWLQKRNKHGIQDGILALQGGIVTALALIFVLVPNVSNAFIALIDMAAALYLIMYLLMFASALILRRKEPNAARGYRVPAMGLVAGVGFVACLAALIMAFIPPTGHSAVSPSAYPWLVAIVVVVLGTPPLLFYHFRRPRWDQRTAPVR